MPLDILDQIKNLFGVQEIKQYEKYLGLPSLVGRKKKVSLLYIKERVAEKLQAWKEQLPSQAGWEVLLKVVILAIPTYAISCFKLPITLCCNIKALIRKFWWSQRGIKERYTSPSGNHYANQKVWEEWVSKSSENSTTPC